jgi:DNA-binding transcriptional MerR regulator
MPRTYSIADLAREFGVTTRTIRFYEDQGMLTPLRDGQRRIYRPRDRTRLKLILRGNGLGFPLAEVRKLIDLYDAPRGEDAQLHRLLAKIAERRHELEAKREDIEASLHDLEAVADNCRDRLIELESKRIKRQGKIAR